jgi:hypothetical protein
MIDGFHSLRNNKCRLVFFFGGVKGGEGATKVVEILSILD